MERKIITTSDGSSTIHLPEWNENYHSIHGAIQEAYHVFINNGLLHFLNFGSKAGAHERINILEMGFGTGLNAFITLLETEKLSTTIDYVGVEAYPVSMNEVLKLNYPSQLMAKIDDMDFLKLHKASWESGQRITAKFSLHKQKRFFNDVSDVGIYNIIYFDAFGARVQPELWTESMFKKMYMALKPKGILVTYSAKGSVRRAMQAVGFKVERLLGPPGKREMLRGTKELLNSVL